MKTLKVILGKKKYFLWPLAALWVPALLVSHYVVFVVMLAGRRAQIHEAFTRRIDASDSPRVPRAGTA